MGCVASISTDPPPRSCVKCLRADAATRASPGRTPLWAVRRQARSLPPVTGRYLQPLLCCCCSVRLGSGVVSKVPAPPPPYAHTAAWTVDEKLHTFVAVASDQAAAPPADAWKLRQPSSEQQEVPAAQQVRAVCGGGGGGAAAASGGGNGWQQACMLACGRSACGSQTFPLPPSHAAHALCCRPRAA